MVMVAPRAAATATATAAMWYDMTCNSHSDSSSPDPSSTQDPARRTSKRGISSECAHLVQPSDGAVQLGLLTALHLEFRADDRGCIGYGLPAYLDAKWQSRRLKKKVRVASRC